MAEQNRKEAFFLLGINYMYGYCGFEKDLDEAEANLREAAELKHNHADFLLGLLMLHKKKSEEASGCRFTGYDQ